MVIFLWRWDGNVFFPRHHCHRWFFNGFTIPGPSPLNVFLQINHWNQWFFDGFPKFRCDGQRWFWPWKRPKNARNRDGSYFATIVRIILDLDERPGVKMSPLQRWIFLIQQVSPKRGRGVPKVLREKPVPLTHILIGHCQHWYLSHHHQTGNNILNSKLESWKMA